MWRNIFKLGWRNLTRNKRRTGLTLLAIVIGVLSLVFARSYIKGIIGSTSDAVIRTETGHIKIAHGEYLRLERILPKEYLVRDLNSLRTALVQMPGFGSMEERLKFNVLLGNRDKNEAAIALGIDPVKENERLKLSEVMIKGEYFPGAYNGLGVVMGKQLAEKLEVTVNDELILVTSDINYSTYALPFKVLGVFETGFGSIDKHLIYIPLEKAREMLDCGDAAHEILVFLKEPEQSLVISKKIEAFLSSGNQDSSIRVIPWQKNELIESLPVMVAIWDKITMIIMFIAALVILNTMLMSVMERFHEIGVIKALGLKNWEVFTLILVEAFILGVIGSVAGGILGSGISLILEKTGVDISQISGGIMEKIEMPFPFIGKVLYPDFTFSIFLGSVVFGIVVTLLAVLYPAFKSMRMLPVEAFRSELKV